MDQIDAAEVDEAATDVLFSRLSRSGGGGLTDGTSARAMLLLRLAAEGACVSFGDAGAVDDGQEDPNDGDRIHHHLFSVGSGSTFAYGVLDTGYRYDLTDEEIAFVESIVRPMEVTP